MKKLLLFSILWMPNFITAQIGIGTNTPSTNAVLDVNSTNKGLMLPRLNNTLAVSSPTAGLIIFDKSTNAPAYHDGTKWNSMMMMPMPSTVGTDSLIYTFLTGYGSIILINNPLPLLSMGIAGATNNNIAVALNKEMDRNTIPLLTIFVDKPTTTTVVMEIKVYKKGTSLHYFSYKFSNIIINAVQSGTSTGGTGNSESYTIEPKIYGWKNNVTGQSIAFNITTGTTVAY